MTVSKVRPIDRRFLPPVKGVDLEQSLNFIDIRDVTERFAYDCYTGARLPYVRGSRPRLEAVARKVTRGAKGPLAQVQAIAKFVAEDVQWAGFYARKTGRRLKPDRNMSEEDIIRSGIGWCNEQARVFCCLTQVLGIPSRLVFACNERKHYGHVITEALLPSGWMAVDQSFGYLFMMKRKPVRAAHIFHKPACRAHFEPIYRKMCHGLVRELGREIMERDFGMGASANPLDGFTDIGYCNHFVL